MSNDVYAWISSPYIYHGTAYVFQIFSRTTGDILPDLACSPCIVRLIGNITVSAPACADDIALLGESKDIQAMLNLLEYNTKRDLVKLNPEKTEVINVSKAL
jgi:hypothetical protein